VLTLTVSKSFSVALDFNRRFTLHDMVTQLSCVVKEFTEKTAPTGDYLLSSFFPSGGFITGSLNIVSLCEHIDEIILFLEKQIKYSIFWP